MASRSSTSIAKKARSMAEVDFATWLMMAKLGKFDDLSSNAQAFLTSYRARLEQMSERQIGGCEEARAETKYPNLKHLIRNPITRCSGGAEQRHKIAQDLLDFPCVRSVCGGLNGRPPWTAP